MGPKVSNSLWEKKHNELQNYERPFRYAYDVLFDYKRVADMCTIIFFMEVFLNLLVVSYVPYTEIDWRAYMQEVKGFLNGTLDYTYLRGDTGPLVYPAGFVYIYSLFYFLTSGGEDVLIAQILFLFLYLGQTFLVLRLHRKTLKVPGYALLIATLTSYRIHSIYVLRLFNDPVAVLLFYIGLNLFLNDRWIAGSVFYSLAVSVKMNILLYAPALLLAYLTNLTLTQTVANLVICGAIQLLLGAPFLYANAFAYVKGSFDLGRIFEHKWTVNFRFLGQAVFEDRKLHVALLCLHMLLLLLFLPRLKRYMSSFARLKATIDGVTKSLKKKQVDGAASLELNYAPANQLFVLPFFVVNLIGIACARSLHYQFYSWYFHSLVYLVFCTNYQKPVKFLILGCIELCWNTYPSTVFSSSLLHVCHVALLIGLYRYMGHYQDKHKSV